MKQTAFLREKERWVYTMFNLSAPELFFFLILAHPVYKYE